MHRALRKALQLKLYIFFNVRCTVLFQNTPKIVNIIYIICPIPKPNGFRNIRILIKRFRWPRTRLLVKLPYSQGDKQLILHTFIRINNSVRTGSASKMARLQAGFGPDGCIMYKKIDA